jgi:hypothetical protein
MPDEVSRAQLASVSSTALWLLMPELGSSPFSRRLMLEEGTQEARCT